LSGVVGVFDQFDKQDGDEMIGLGVSLGTVLNFESKQEGTR
jgi:hypothetical protein